MVLRWLTIVYFFTPSGHIVTTLKPMHLLTASSLRLPIYINIDYYHLIIVVLLTGHFLFIIFFPLIILYFSYTGSRNPYKA